jgi:hypothetical protein
MAIEDSTTNPLASAEVLTTARAPPRAILDSRKITVGHIGPGKTYLRLQGRWLERAGFSAGTHVRVYVSERRLVVEAVEPEEPLRCAEPNCPHEAKRTKRRGNRLRTRAHGQLAITS